MDVDAQRGGLGQGGTVSGWNCYLDKRIMRIYEFWNFAVKEAGYVFVSPFRAGCCRRMEIGELKLVFFFKPFRDGRLGDWPHRSMSFCVGVDSLDRFRLCCCRCCWGRFELRLHLGLVLHFSFEWFNLIYF